MKKTHRSKPAKCSDEMKAEYDFDYHKAKPNRFAGRAGKDCTVVVLNAYAKSVEVCEDSLVVDLTDGRTITAPLVWYPRLWHGNEQERANFEIIGDGAYIHWPDLDEDLTVAGILAGRRSGESPTSLKKWLATRS